MVQNIIVECAKIKAAIVTEDETELGPRSLLNFGHTIGHAIEVFLSFFNSLFTNHSLFAWTLCYMVSV